MGGKQSVESPPPGGVSINSYPHSSGGGGPDHNRAESSGMSRNGPGRANNQAAGRLERAHSTMHSNAMRIPRHRSETIGPNNPQPSGSSSSSEESRSSRMLSWLQRRSHPNVSRSLPQYFYKKDAVCAMCRKLIPAEDVEVHFVMCITKPRVSYNEDILSADSGECAICLEDMEKGDPIARLPCLCIYHKGCIQQWFKKGQT